MRAFIDSVRQRLQEHPVDEPASTTASHWMTWAIEQLQRQDAVTTFVEAPWPEAPMPDPISTPWHWK